MPRLPTLLNPERTTRPERCHVCARYFAAGAGWAARKEPGAGRKTGARAFWCGPCYAAADEAGFIQHWQAESAAERRYRTGAGKIVDFATVSQAARPDQGYGSGREGENGLDQ